MPATTVQIRTTDHYAVISPAVYHRAQWQDSWTQIDGATVRTLTNSSGAGIGEADFVFEYGTILGQSDTIPQDIEPLDIADHWIKIVFTPHAGPDDPIEEVSWYGIARDEVRSEYSSTGNLSGTQAWSVVGLEWLLTRSQYTESVFDDSTTGGPGATVTVKHGTTFNAQRGDKFGNRNGSLFDLASESDDVWTATQIIEYLLANHAPGDANSPMWELAGQTTALDGVIPTDLAVHGQTLFDIINSIITTRRGFIWSINVIEDAGTPANERFQVVMRSLLESDMVLPGGDTIPANTTQWDVDLLTEVGVRSVTRVQTTQQRYSSVAVEGARRGAVFTATLPELRDWTTQNVTDYKAATGGASALVSQQRAVRDAIRYSDDPIRNCWTRYAIPFDWSNISDQNLTVFPDYDWKGETLGTGGTSLYMNGIRFEEYTPMLEGIDYSDPDAPVDNRDANSTPKQVRSFVVIEDPKEAATYIDVETIGSQSLNEDGSDPGIPFGIRLEVRSDRAGFHLRPSDAPHQLGLVDDTGSFSPDLEFAAVADLLTTDHAPRLKWDTGLATFYATIDERVRVEHPDPATQSTVYNHEPQLVIQIGDRAHQDFIAVNTVIRIDDDGTLVRNSADGFIRDDTPYMRDLARIAYTWYSVKRVSLNMQLWQITDQLRVGDFINSITSSGDVNAVVSTVAWDFLDNSTKITTQFGELDIEGLLV